MSRLHWWQNLLIIQKRDGDVSFILLFPSSAKINLSSASGSWGNTERVSGPLLCAAGSMQHILQLNGASCLNSRYFSFINCCRHHRVGFKSLRFMGKDKLVTCNVARTAIKLGDNLKRENCGCVNDWRQDVVAQLKKFENGNGDVFILILVQIFLLCALWSKNVILTST
jgi:hypothetical protein